MSITNTISAVSTSAAISVIRISATTIAAFCEIITKDLLSGCSVFLRNVSAMTLSLSTISNAVSLMKVVIFSIICSSFDVNKILVLNELNRSYKDLSPGPRLSSSHRILFHPNHDANHQTVFEMKYNVDGKNMISARRNTAMHVPVLHVRFISF